MQECKNCPINEQTADGHVCGRCWFFLEDGKTCPRHGDVSGPVERYKTGGGLTLETEFKQADKGANREKD